MIELLLCTMIWGASFIAQKLGADHFGPFAINSYRNLIAGVFLIVCMQIRNCRREKARTSSKVMFGGILSGVCVIAAEVSQQFGIEHTTPGISAFLTSNYVLLVPLLGCLLGRRIGVWVWGGVALAICGSYFICFPASEPVPSFSALGSGEAWTLLCAVFFAIQIMVVDHFASRSDLLLFSTVQMTTAGVVALPFVFLPSELARASWPDFVQGLPALLFLGILASGVSYTLQILGQAKVSAAAASVVMSLEGAFAAVFGWLLLGDAMTSRQIIGCALIFAAPFLPSLRALWPGKEV